MATMNKWETSFYRTKEFLDSLPLKDEIAKMEDLYDIMDKIQNKYGKSVKDDPVFEGEIFNCMSVDEFADYLRDKGYNIWEEVITKYRVII